MRMRKNKGEREGDAAQPDMEDSGKLDMQSEQKEVNSHKVKST